MTKIVNKITTSNGTISLYTNPMSVHDIREELSMAIAEYATNKIKKAFDLLPKTVQKNIAKSKYGVGLEALGLYIFNKHKDIYYIPKYSSLHISELTKKSWVKL